MDMVRGDRAAEGPPAPLGVGIRSYASPPSVGGREGWYVLDDPRIRRFSTLTSGRLRPCGTGPRLRAG